MGYKVKIIPKHSAEGWLAKGCKTAEPTYYPSPNHAVRSAEGYVRRHPGDVCNILTWRDDVFVKEVR